MLGSEIRLCLTQLLWAGEQTAQALSEGIGASGNRYHHLRERSSMRWIDTPQRNRYAITGEGKVALQCALHMRITQGKEAGQSGAKLPEPESTPDA